MSPHTPISIHHVNFVVERGTLDQAKEFYCDVIGFGSDPVPQLQRDSLMWYAFTQSSDDFYYNNSLHHHIGSGSVMAHNK